MKRTIAALATSCALAVTLVPGPAAYAGPRSREEVVVHEAAVLAELFAGYHDARALPAKLNNKRALRLVGYKLAKHTKIVRYQRTRGGRDYRLCVTHKRGGWATWDSHARDIKSAGRGAACRF